MNSYADATWNVVAWAAAGYGIGLVFVVVLLFIGNKGEK